MTCATCQVRQTTSPIRPIAWASEDVIESAPRSCRTSSAAIVVARIRDSAKARSSGTRGLRWWQTISMSRCSATVLTVCGSVGFVDPGITWGSEATSMMSGAWPPPAPSVWNAWIERPAMAATVDSRNPASFSESECSATCSPCSSAARRAASMAAGVEPQSSCTLYAAAPASACSASDRGADGVALAHEQHVDRQVVERAVDRPQVPRPGGHGRRPRPLRRSGAAARRRWWCRSRAPRAPARSTGSARACRSRRR